MLYFSLWCHREEVRCFCEPTGVPDEARLVGVVDVTTYVFHRASPEAGKSKYMDPHVASGRTLLRVTRWNNLYLGYTNFETALRICVMASSGRLSPGSLTPLET